MPLGSGHITTTTHEVFIPELWTVEVVDYASQRSIMADLVTRFDEVAQEYGIGRPEVVFSYQPLSVRCRRCGSEKAIEQPELGFREIWHNPEGAPLPTHCDSCGATEIEFPGASRFDVEGIEGEIPDDAAGD